jgi:glycosyltransferase involved in cell wall biosynthesis
MKKTFSIVIPVHNKEKYIKRTLKSVLGQSYVNFEVILVNDGSTDSSGEICDNFALTDSRIKVIHQTNGGVSNARNTGIEAASSDLIAFIDADDIWDPIFLEQMSGLIKHFPNVDIYSAKYATIKDGNINIGKDFFPGDENFILFDLIEECAEKVRFPIHSSSVIIRKHAIEKVGYFDERIVFFEDYDLFVRIALQSKVAYLNTKPLSFYNLDVPVESKARGAIPDLNKHWITYFDKFQSHLEKNKKLQLLLDRAILTQLISYNKHPNYREKIKPFLKQVHPENFSFKYRIIYYTPIFISNLILNSYLWIMSFLRKY